MREKVAKVEGRGNFFQSRAPHLMRLVRPCRRLTPINRTEKHGGVTQRAPMIQ